MNNKDLVIYENNKAITTSLKIAEYFDKRHDNVLRDIENLECPEDFRALNFEVSSYNTKQNKEKLAYNITKDGFTFLAMGFTGKEAAKFKIDYENDRNIWGTKLSYSKIRVTYLDNRNCVR